MLSLWISLTFTPLWAAPSRKPERPFWTERTSYSRGGQVFFVGVSTGNETLEEGRKQAFEAARQEAMDHIQIQDTHGLTFHTQMNYEERTEDGYTVFRLIWVSAKDLQKFKKKEVSGKPRYLTRKHYNGNIKSKVPLVQGLPNGLMKEYYSNGKLKSKGRVRNGLKVGAWTYWHDNGVKSREGKYVRGEPEGHWKLYFDNGIKEEEGSYSKGRRMAPRKVFSEEGKLLERWTWIDRKKDTWKVVELDPESSQKLVEREYWGEQVRVEKKFFENGKVRTLARFNQRGDKAGTWEWFYETGKKKEAVPYRSGQIHGQAKAWFASGKLQYEASFVRGKEEGKVKGYHPNGKVAFLVTKKGGEDHGPNTHWYDNGKKHTEGRYRQGQRHGTHKAWYPNGKPKYVKVYDKGTLHGSHRVWDEDGDLESTHYTHGQESPDGGRGLASKKKK